MPDITELEEAVKDAQALPSLDEFEETEDDIDEELEDKFKVAVAFMESAGRFIDYLTDPKLCKTISKRERDNAQRFLIELYENINAFNQVINDMESEE